MREMLAPFGRHRRAVLGVSVLAFAAAGLEALTLILVVPLLIASLEGASSVSLELGPVPAEVGVGPMVGLTIAAVVGAAILTVLAAVVRARAIADWENERRTDLVHRFLGASWSVQQAERSGGLQTLVTYITGGSVVLSAAMLGLRALMAVAVFVTATLVVDWRSALLVIVAGGGLFLVLRPLVVYLRRLTGRFADLNHRFFVELGELHDAAPEIRVFSAEGAFERRLDSLAGQIRGVRSRQGWVSASLNPLYQYAGMIVLLGVVLVGGRFGFASATSVGAVALLLLRSLQYGQQLQGSYQAMVEAAPYLDRLERALDELAPARVVHGAARVDEVHEIRFEQVGYVYEDGKRALEGVDISLRFGETVGIAGPSGSGKSTLSQILLCLRTPSEGRVTVNGVDLAGVDPRSWYERVALVPQSPRLLHGTVADNLSYLSGGHEREQLVEAARSAGLHEVIEALPQGYETNIGPSTRALSGGQLQRLGIARALLRSPSVLVLDEPTSALDIESEQLIQRTLQAMAGHALVVIIAHRLTTLSICDHLVVLRSGRVEAAGPLRDVIRESPFLTDRAADLLSPLPGGSGGAQ